MSERGEVLREFVGVYIGSATHAERDMADEIIRLRTALADAQRERGALIKALAGVAEAGDGLLDVATGMRRLHERAESADTRATRAEQQVAVMAKVVVEAAEEWEVAKVQATAARMVAGATGGPVHAPDRSETLANMRLVSAVRAYRARAQEGA